MRSTLIFLHKYIGLVLGLLLSITGISGSLLVFDRELDEFLAPETADFMPATELASLDLALTNATAAVDNGTEPTRIALGRHAGAPHIIRFPAPAGAPGPIEVSVNPGTAEVTAVRGWGEYPVTWIYHLHLSFFGGATGKIVVGIMGFCLLFFCISGAVIWWPRSSRKPGRWKQAFSVRTGRGSFRFNYDLHKSIGIWFLPVFMMLAFTGIEIVWHEPMEKVVSWFLPVDEHPVVTSGTGTDPISVDAAAAAAQAIFPESSLKRVYLPQGEKAPYEITFSHPEEPWAEYAMTSVMVDQYSASVLNVWDGREAPAGNTFLDWLFPLHNGDALGLAGRILLFISGFLPAILFGTGVYMWLRKRKTSTSSQFSQASVWSID